MNAIAGNDSVTALVRQHDPDRFLTALFAPADRRDTLMTLYGFNHELARAREVASQPMLALIRLQWWREVVEGTPKRHEIASPLSAAIAAGRLDPADLLAMIEAREREAEDALETLEDWRAWLLQGVGSVSVAAARLLGAPEPEAFRRFGAAYGAAGVLRSVGILARAGRCPLPLDLLAAEGLTPEAAMAAAQIRHSRGREGNEPGQTDAASVGPTVGAHAGPQLNEAPAPRAPQGNGWSAAATSSLPDFTTAGSDRRVAREGSHFKRDDRIAVDQTALRRVLQRLAAEISPWLGRRSLVTSRSAVAAALPAALARRDLARIGRDWQPRGLGDRIAVTVAAVTGRV